jgi:hypothetical protein
MDPFQGLASFVLGRLKQSAMALYLKAIFTMIASGVLSFLFTCGTSLVSTRVWSISVGTGMIVASIVMVVAFKQSDLAKKLSIVIPQLEAEQLKVEGTTTIQK